MISHAEEVAAWMQGRWWSRRLGAIIYLTVMPAYMVWLFFLFNNQVPVLSALFIAANLIDFVLGLILIYFTWHHPRRTPPKPERIPSLDILVPVYTEPVEMIELTVRAAQKIEVPHETYLLDDGRRPKIRAIAERLGVHYLVRADRKGAKAGNLNNGLRVAKGELVAVFDADHVPRRDAFVSALGYFNDPTVVMVQTPQFYYNEDAFTYQIAHSPHHVAAGLWSEQSLYYDLFQQGRDAFNAMSSVGTGVIYRRSALDAIGWFPETTITEDLHASILLHRNGGKFVHINEPVAWGLAASDLTEFNRTRYRWSYGNLHVLRHENIFFCKGLTLWQRLSYLGLCLYALEVWQQLFYLIIPAWALIALTSPVQMTPLSALLMPICVVLRIGSFLLIGGGYVRFVDDQVVALGRMPINLAAWWGATGRSTSWKPSGKKRQDGVPVSALMPHVAIIAMNIAVIAYLCIHWMPRHWTWQEFTPFYISFFCLLWVFFTIWKSWQWIYKAILVTQHFGQEYLFQAPVPLLDETGRGIGHFLRLSTTEGEIVTTTSPALTNGMKIQLLVPGASVPARVTGVNQNDTKWRIKFVCEDSDSLWWLRQSLYSVDWHRLIRLAPLSRQTQRQGLAGFWQAAWLEIDGKSHWAAFQASDSMAKPKHLLVTRPLPVGQSICLYWLKDGQIQQQFFEIMGEKIVNPPFPKDLNDQSYFIFKLDSSSS